MAECTKPTLKWTIILLWNLESGISKNTGLYCIYTNHSVITTAISAAERIKREKRLFNPVNIYFCLFLSRNGKLFSGKRFSVGLTALALK